MHHIYIFFIYNTWIFFTSDVMSVVQKMAFEGENVTLPCSACTAISSERQWVVQDQDGTEVAVAGCVSATFCYYQHHLTGRAQIDSRSGNLTIYNIRLSDEYLYIEKTSSTRIQTKVSLEIYGGYESSKDYKSDDKIRINDFGQAEMIIAKTVAC